MRARLRELIYAHPPEVAYQRPEGVCNDLPGGYGCSVSFCIRQLSSSATYRLFSDGHEIS